MSRFLTLLLVLCAVLACFAPEVSAKRTLVNTAAPSPNEGVDGVEEGNGEGATTATPDADEGDDGVLEGAGEGDTVPATDEGADGVFEGSGEGTTEPEAADGVPSPDEGLDGVEEGNGEGSAAGPSSVLASFAAVTAAAAAIVLV